MTVPMDAETRRFVLSILDDAPDLTVAANRPDGFPQATVVGFVHDDGVIYFACGATSQKARNLARDDRVSLTVTPPYDDWNAIRGLSLGARAKRVTDPKEVERVGALMLKRFPQAAEFIESEAAADMALFRVEPVAVSVLDYAKGFGHTELFGPDPAPTAQRARA